MPNPFKPTAGATPPLLVGRRPILEAFQESIDDGPGSPYLLQLMTGARGVGKTVMLNELGEVAQRNGWVVIHATAGPGMLERIARRARRYRQELGAPDRVAGTTSWKITTPVGELGREFYDADPELRVWVDDLADLLEALEEHGTGVCVTVDEIHSLDLDQMQVLAGDIQMLIREGRRIALIMAGLPRAVEELLAGDRRPTTFLRRAERPLLADVPVAEVADSFLEIIAAAGRSISDELAMACAEATDGYPFMIQLVGYHVWRQAGTGPITPDHVTTGVAAAQARLGALVHAPALADLSAVDRTFLVMMARDNGPSRLGEIAGRMGRESRYASVYRDRLLKAGMIRSAGYGLVDFEAPYLREYLREHAAHLVSGQDDGQG
ncbi:ATP-binding protein [Kocuria sp. SM24M-10]|uniref:ATP-binding protein n=1 Tax=Kocuria sp. SM24M-10 TaxID=1660349 RepID=UPI00064A548D|nr:ATP-binding protein [Kocuria sp. SM24M-10]KLU11062.1 ATPase AAA [Kocuria sp. SM24M-10]